MRGTIWRKLAISKGEHWVWFAFMYEFPRCARAAFLISSKMGGGTIWRKLVIFKKEKLNLVCFLNLFYIYKFSALRARPLSSHIKWGMIWRTLAIFKRGHWVLLECLLFYIKHFRAARATFVENGSLKREHITHAWLTNCMGPILTKMTILKTRTNAFLQFFAWGAILKNGNFNYTKLVMHVYKLWNAILTEMKT